MTTPNENRYVFSLSHDDYRDYYMYHASTDPQTLARRKKNQTIFLIVLLGITAFFIYRNYTINQQFNIAYIGVYLLLLVIATALRKFLEKNRIKSLLAKQIDQDLASEIGKTHEIVFTQAGIQLTENGATALIAYSDVKQIIEAPKHFYIISNDDSALIVPKRGIDEVSFEQSLQEIATVYNIPFNKDLQWKW